jgi:predicted ATPase/class 3 adenylate cyclase
MRHNLPTGTVTFLFTDIEGSTKLAQEYVDTWESLRKRHDAILRNAIESQNGYVFRTVGDAFCAAFRTAGDALRAAFTSQLKLNAEISQGLRIKVRMGIHTGEAEIQEDGDYLGYLTLTRVQRVMSAAHGGQILLSNATAELARNELPESVSLRDMRQHRLKGLSQPERLWQVIAPGLQGDFPPLETLTDIPNNLPLQLTSFIGREQEVKAIEREIGNHRLITLTGPGGIGKTRLSLQVAPDLLDTFQHGIWFVELAPVTDSALVPVVIAHVFHLQEMGGRRMVDSLLDYLREKETLLILDNFEQVIEAAPLVKELLITASHLKVMVTSRTPLRVSGEYEYQVPLLPMPHQQEPLNLEQLVQFGSVQLFVERARSVRADFVLAPENAPAVAEICQRLDGLPLAIELAAARVRVLPPQKMLNQLDHRLQFLTSHARDLPARQQTLRAAIAWSYDLLTQSEKSLFRQLAIFVGGATLEAIEAVCNIGDNRNLLNELESLLDKNLIRQIEQDREARYEMLETIGDFADEILIASGEATLTQARHLIYFHRLAQDAEPNLVGPNELQWIARLTTEHDNLRAAILWGLKNDVEAAVQMLSHLAFFWSRAGHNEEAIRWLHLALADPALAQAEPVSLQVRNLRARALLTLGILALQQEYSEAPATLREAIALLRQLDNRPDLAAGLAYAGFLGDLEAAQESVAIARTTGNKWILAYSLAWQSQALRIAGGDLQLAQRSAAEGATLSREIGSVWMIARCVFSQGQLAVALGELAQAHACFQECLTLFSQGRDRYHANMARTELAHLERWQGNYTKALLLYKSAIVVWQDLGLQAAVARQMECLAMIAAAQQNTKYAARLSGAAKKLRYQTGSQLAPNEQVEYDIHLEAIRSHLGTQRFTSPLTEGQAMTAPEAVAYALSLPDSPERPVS